MKKSKKILSVLLALIMIISVIPMSSITVSAAETSGACGENLTWTFDESTGTLTISGTGAMSDYEYVGTTPWSHINSNIKAVVINNGVTTIGVGAFFECLNLLNVIIPDSVKQIDGYAFYKCTNLVNITIPDSVNTIGDKAFSFCSSLTYVTIPDSVTTIGVGAFCYCNSLTSIEVDSNNPYYSSNEDGVLFNKDKTTLVQYPAGNIRTSYTIPDCVVTIGRDAFTRCNSLTSVIIGGNVTTIGKYAFSDCNYLENITVGNKVTEIGTCAFFYCTSLTGITIPDSVTTIGYNAFEHCTSLTSITIPDSVTTIGNFAFACCISLENVIIGQGVKTLGKNAFTDCYNLKSVMIPKTVTEINHGVFLDCDNLKYVYYSGTEDDWNSIVIEDNNEPLSNMSIHFNVQNESDIITFEVLEPSRTELRNRDGIVLHTAVDGNIPDGWYINWSSDNNNFKEKTKENDLQIIAKNNGYTTFTAKLCDADGKVIAIDSVELYSQSSFFDKIGGLFRLIFGLTNIYEY